MWGKATFVGETEKTFSLKYCSFNYLDLNNNSIYIWYNTVITDKITLIYFNKIHDSTAKDNQIYQNIELKFPI